jgi:prepilin-type N-terminal cleavage/methylation domain-containing protein
MSLMPKGEVRFCGSELARDFSVSQTSRASSLPPIETTKGFSLLELLVVVGLIAALLFFLVSGPGGSGQSAALQSAQAVMANMVTAARTKAMATGKSSRVLIQVDATSTSQPLRYLRYVAVQTQTTSGWQTFTDLFLPDGVYVVPGNFTVIPAGLFAADTSVPWTKADGSALRSTALRSNQITSETINSLSAEQWVSFTISANAGTVQSGDIILATGRLRPPGSYETGESPVELINPEKVRGLTLSSYGVPALINARTSF